MEVNAQVRFERQPLHPARACKHTPPYTTPNPLNTTSRPHNTTLMPPKTTPEAAQYSSRGRPTQPRGRPIQPPRPPSYNHEAPNTTPRPPNTNLRATNTGPRPPNTTLCCATCAPAQTQNCTAAKKNCTAGKQNCTAVFVPIWADFKPWVYFHRYLPIKTKNCTAICFLQCSFFLLHCSETCLCWFSRCTQILPDLDWSPQCLVFVRLSVIWAGHRKGKGSVPVIAVIQTTAT